MKNEYNPLIGKFELTASRTNAETLELKQGGIKASYKQLVTSEIGTCSALAFTYKGGNFLAHVDARTLPDEIENEIRSNFDLQKLKDSETKILFWRGTYQDRQVHPNRIIMQALQNLGLLEKGRAINMGTVTHTAEIGANSNGVFVEDYCSIKATTPKGGGYGDFFQRKFFSQARS